jgi:hypothetical protein
VNNGGFIEGGSLELDNLPSRMQVGLPIGYFYGYKTDGVFSKSSRN